MSLLQQGASVRKEQRLGQASSNDVAKKQGKQKRQNLDVPRDSSQKPSSAAKESSCSAAATRVFQSCPGSGGIRTHAPEETGALIQRLRPLGHATLWVFRSTGRRPVESPNADFAKKAAV